MSKRTGFAALVAVLLLGMMTLSFGASAPVAQAQGAEPDVEEFNVYVELHGVVLAITPGLLLTLDGGDPAVTTDDVNVVLTTDTFLAGGVAAGITVTVVAHLEDDQFVADTVYLDLPGVQPVQLILAAMGCVDGQVGVHFVLLNVPENATVGNLDYTYGAGLPSESQTGGVWHYWAYLPSGSYNVDTASVTVDGQVISLSNPGAFTGEYDCAATPEPTLEPTLEPTMEPTEVADCVGADPHPVGMRLAEAFDVPYDEIMAWHCQGIGFGEIARAYALQDITAEDEEPLTVEGLFDRRFAGEGWGNIVKDSGVEPNRLAPGQIRRFSDDDDDQDDQEMDQQSEQDNDRPGNSGNAPGQNKDDRGTGNNSRNNNSRNNNNRGGRNR